MKRDNKIAKPKVDFVFKKLFGTEENIHLLRYFISTVLDLPEDDLKNIELIPTEKLRETEDDKSSIFDISARINAKEKINIEIQVIDELNMIHRSLYYWSNMYVKELKKGMNYNELNKCICINVLGFDKTKSSGIHSKYHIREDEQNFKLTDLLEMHFIELPKIDKNIMLDEELSEMEKLARFLDAETKEEIVMLSKSSASLKKAAEVIEEIENNDLMWAEYIAREKYIREKDMNQNVLIEHYKNVGLKAGREEGIKEGREEGIKEGKKKGLQEGRIEERKATAKNLYKLGVDIETISKATGLSEKEIKELNNII